MIKIVPLYLFEIVTIVFITIALFISIRALAMRSGKLTRLRKSVLYLLHVCCFSALLCLILQPQVKLNFKSQTKVRLITTDVEIEKIDENILSYSLVNPASHNRSDDASLISSHNAILKIKSPHQILVKHPNLTELEVLGDGLTAHDWKGFEEVKISYNKPKLVSGLVEVSWNKKLNLGDTLIISARYQGDISQSVTVQLFDPAGEKVAEKIVRANEYFKLSDKPKLPGLHQYKVLVLYESKKNKVNSEGRSIANLENLIVTESINLQVQNRAQAKLLVLQSSPSFEIKQLQNWVAENGAEVIVKTKISQNRYLTRRTNFKAEVESILSPTLFDQVDMLIIDGRGLIELSAIELEWMDQAITNGLGLLILVDQELAEQHKLEPLKLIPNVQFNSTSGIDEVIPYWLDNNNRYQAMTDMFLPKGDFSFQLFSNLSVNAQRLVESEKNDLLVHQNDLGRGRVALSLIKSTHQWVTSGNKSTHSQYWANLINHIARRKEVDFHYVVDNAKLNFEGMLTEQCFESKLKVQQLIFNSLSDLSGEQVVLLQDTSNFNHESCGYFWPNAAGWYESKISLNSFEVINSGTSTKVDETFWQHIEPRESWQAVQQSERIEATLAKKNMNTVIKPLNMSVYFHSIDLWYFWWLFLISASLIWLESKFE